MVVCVRYIHVARCASADTDRIAEKRDCANPVDGATGVPRRVAARKSSDGSIGIDETNIVIVSVSHKHVAKGVNADTVRISKKCHRADCSIVRATNGSRCVAARDSNDGLIGIDEVRIRVRVRDRVSGPIPACLRVAECWKSILSDFPQYNFAGRCRRPRQ